VNIIEEIVCKVFSFYETAMKWKSTVLSSINLYKNKTSDLTSGTLYIPASYVYIAILSNGIFPLLILPLPPTEPSP